MTIPPPPRCCNPAVLLGLLLLLGTIPPSSQWSSSSNNRLRRTPPSSSRWGTATSSDNNIGIGGSRVESNNSNNNSSNNNNNGGDASTIKSYEYDGWKLTYRTMVDDNELGDDYRNVLLIHPVGIGLASWFWDPLLARIRDRNQHQNDGIGTGASCNSNSSNVKLRAYAPNLIGCGISEGSDAWDPDRRGLFVPLGWARGCEALMDHVRDDDNDSDSDNDNEAAPERPWTIVAQGGLAPVGILLAARNPDRVARLVLASPPTWEDVTSAVPQAELERNYNFLRSPILGPLAFYFLEKRSFVRFFSNLFLFTTENVESDGAARLDVETWLDNTERELCPAARPPVQAFNAGLCQNRSFEEELEAIFQKVVVVQGANDKRERSEYPQNLADCELVVVPGTTNVIPWERPEALLDLLE